MKILPQNRADRIRFACLVCLLAGVGVFYRLDRVVAFCLSDKQVGDVVFQSLPKGPRVETIEGVTRSEWSHCGILVRRDGKWMVAEAIGQVRYTPLYLWVVRGRRAKVESYRLVEQPGDLDGKLEAGIETMLGRQYDYRYAPEDDEIYCSELVHKVYDRAFGIKIGEWERLGDLNWRPHEGFIRETENGTLPLDRLMVTPVGLTRSPLVRRVF
jgi:hypothetical protein